MYMVYLSIFDRYIYQWSTTITHELQTADAAFQELIGFHFLACRPFQVTLLCNGKILAHHRFDSAAGSSDDWSDRALPIDLGMLEQISASATSP